MRCRKLYDHAQLIRCMVSGEEPPYLTPLQEQQVKILFKAASHGFHQNNGIQRKHMISLSVLFLKLASFLGLKGFDTVVPRIKSKEKLANQEEHFARICRNLGWDPDSSRPDREPPADRVPGQG